ncbi:FlgO family outer membrane protein [Magnetococcus sp. PR-3]|uniref:FlgO family outer membrane protein n=1 Tax=Magnetococcus sp. PR-3 TaxID=3120355 RepID=UPI002FCE44FE
MNKKTFVKGLAVTLLTAAMVSGCAQPRFPDTYPLVSTPSEQASPPETELLTTAYGAADAMITNLADRFPSRFPIVAGSFVNNDDLTKTTSLGRLVSQQMAARFTQSGYTVTQMNLRSDLLMKPKQGQFVLTRELDKISKETRAEAIFAGTYTVARSRVFFNVQLIRIKDRATLGAQDFSVPISSNVRVLLDPKSRM